MHMGVLNIPVNLGYSSTAPPPDVINLAYDSADVPACKEGNKGHILL
jgi:hypothetical protein